MILKVYSIFDSKAKAHQRVSFFRYPAEALRSFSAGCSDPKNELFNHAEDYSLCEIGTFDDDTGLLTPYLQPLTVMTASVASNKHKEFYASRQFADYDHELQSATTM